LKILNLYAGIGGNRKLWPDGHEITAVEYNPDIAKIYQDFFPDDNVIVGDAHQYLLEHFKKFDFIWTSPPCPSHSRLNTMLNKNGVNRYPDMKLYEEIIFLKHWHYNKFVVENVRPYYEPLVSAQEAGRHLFWTNFYISNYKRENEKIHTNVKATDTVYGRNLDKYHVQNKVKILNNMVDPKLGLHIWNCAFRDVQLEMF
jgi:DNA (cytosine-5)-methyltransferase 1